MNDDGFVVSSISRWSTDAKFRTLLIPGKAPTYHILSIFKSPNKKSSQESCYQNGENLPPMFIQISENSMPSCQLQKIFEFEKNPRNFPGFVTTSAITASHSERLTARAGSEFRKAATSIHWMHHMPHGGKRWCQGSLAPSRCG